MNDTFAEEILSAHAEQLKRGKTNAESYLAAFPEERDELAPLLNLADTLKRVLVPVKPSEVFRERLRAGLKLAGHHQAAERRLNLWSRRHLNYWWVGAAAIGASVAAGGIIAWVARRSSHTAHSHAN